MKELRFIDCLTTFNDKLIDWRVRQQIMFKKN